MRQAVDECAAAVGSAAIDLSAVLDVLLPVLRGEVREKLPIQHPPPAFLFPTQPSCSHQPLTFPALENSPPAAPPATTEANQLRNGFEPDARASIHVSGFRRVEQAPDPGPHGPEARPVGLVVGATGGAAAAGGAGLRGALRSGAARRRPFPRWGALGGGAGGVQGGGRDGPFGRAAGAASPVGCEKLACSRSRRPRLCVNAAYFRRAVFFAAAGGRAGGGGRLVLRGSSLQSVVILISRELSG